MCENIRILLSMIPCVSLTETSVLGNMKERVKEMRVFGCRLNFWNNIQPTLNNNEKGIFIIIYILIKTIINCI